MTSHSETIQQKALSVLSERRVAVFIVAFNAERHIGRVLARIPTWVSEKLAEVFVIDDCSEDNTVLTANRHEWPVTAAPLKVYRTPENQGYGGNQKIGFSYAIEKGFDIVVLLHGDGQYAPEALPDLLAPYADGADAVFGSRFLTAGAARRGGMPYYKYVGNRILSTVQNAGMRAHLSEWHSGYRSYSTNVLRYIPYSANSNNFEFDTEIIIQALGARFKIVEVPIPTYYGDEICRVNGFPYAFHCVQSVLHYRCMQFGLFFDPKFDLTPWTDDSYRYKRKVAETTVHYFVRNMPLEPGARILDVGGGDGRAVAVDLVERGRHVTCIDQFSPRQSGASVHHQVDLDLPWAGQFPENGFDAVVALDVIEHLKRPEAGVASIFQKLKTGGMLYASTGNVAYFPLRLLLLSGFFNYGRKGILDRTHTRLFTIGSFRRLLAQGGLRVVDVRGFGPPIADLVGKDSAVLKWLDMVAYHLARLWPSVFAYQIFVTAQKTADLQSLVERTISYAHRQE